MGTSDSSCGNHSTQDPTPQSIAACSHTDGAGICGMRATSRIETGWDGFADGRRRGYCMVPGIPKTKRALVTWKPFQTSKPTDDEVAHWKQCFREINPLMVTGATSGLLVVDQDGVIGYCEIGKRGKFPPTVMVQTPRGDFHEHYWFKRPPDLSYIPGFAGGYHNNDLPDVDLRADGCIAVYPGGIHKLGGMYRFKEGHSPDEVEIADLPTWLYEYILKRLAEIAAEEAERQRRSDEAERLAQLRENSVVLRLRHVGYNDRLTRYAEAAKRAQLAKVTQAVDGQRNNALYRASCSLAAFLSEGIWPEVELEGELERAALSVGLGSDSNCGMSGIRRTIASGLRRGRSNKVVLPASAPVRVRR